MASLRTLGLGKTMEGKLISVGIETAEDLRKAGSREAVLRLLARYPSTCVVILYHLEAALEGVEIKTLEPDVKAELKEFFRELKV